MRDCAWYGLFTFKEFHSQRFESFERFVAIYHDSIHRMATESNMMTFLGPLRPIICDFGLSREVAKDGMMTPETGTYRWMASEVIAHQGIQPVPMCIALQLCYGKSFARPMPTQNTRLQALLRWYRKEYGQFCQFPSHNDERNGAMLDFRTGKSPAIYRFSHGLRIHIPGLPQN